MNNINTNNPYDTQFLKNYELILKLLEIECFESIQILRITLGNYN